MFRQPIDRTPRKQFVQRRIAVAGLGKGCGTSFVAGLLACRLAEGGSCTLAELGTPYFSLALGADLRVENGAVYYEDLLDKKISLLGVRNMYGSIDLLLRRPGAQGMAPSSCALRMPGEQVVFDLSGADDAYLADVFADMDSIYLVADPMPSALLGAAERLKELKLAFPDIRIIVNKMNKAVHKAELRRFLGGKEHAAVPLLDPVIFYKAEYNCVFPCELAEAAKLLKDISLDC